MDDIVSPAEQRSSSSMRSDWDGAASPVPTIVVRFLFCSLVGVIAACSFGGKKPMPSFDPKLASEVSASAAEAAVSKPGTKVCRWVPLGIAERDLIRGVVQQRDGTDAVRVRIEDPGRFPNSLNGTILAKGVTVRDRASAWTPCVF